MLVIISDLHLTDGTSGTTIDPDAFNIFRERLRDLAWAASDRKVDGTNTYDPIHEIHLILLGDILDVIRSTRWLEGSIRPWNKPNAPEFIKKVRDITDAILEHNNRALKILKSLKQNGVQVPMEQVPEGNLDLVKKQAVKVHTYYMVGNHDWFYHLPGSAFDEIRASIVDALGLDNKSNEVFPHDLSESDVLKQTCDEHHVFVRHGDI